MPVISTIHPHVRGAARQSVMRAFFALFPEEFLQTFQQEFCRQFCRQGPPVFYNLHKWRFTDMISTCFHLFSYAKRYRINKEDDSYEPERTEFSEAA